MKPEDATSYTERCFRGELASCSYGCPFYLDIRSFLEKVKKGRWSPAYKFLRDSTVFPVVVSTLCDQPCRECCQRPLLGDEALALRDLEAATVRYAKDRKPDFYVIPPKSQKIAVIGAGPAGLSAALSLAQKKYQVTVFEKAAGWGGVLRTHERWPEFEADIALQFSAVEVEFGYGCEIATPAQLEALLAEGQAAPNSGPAAEAAGPGGAGGGPEGGFDAAYVATGTGGESFGLLESWDPDLLTTANPKVFMGGMLCGATLMEAIAHGPQVSKTLEAFLQTGKAARSPGDHDKVEDGTKCRRYVRHDGVVSVPLVRAAGPAGYTEEEAKAEAARCLECDCDTCIVFCEMLQWFRKDPKRIAVEVYTDMIANPPLTTRKVTRETYSCNICGYCKSVCPESVDIGALLQFSRAARMSAGIHPAALHDFWLREMDFATSEGSFWSAPKGRETCRYAFYPGCQLGAFNPAHVLKSYELLHEGYEAGLVLGCCGAPAYWAGDEERLKANIEATRGAWNDLGRPTLIFACATCAGLFKLLLPEIPRLSLYEILAVSTDVTPVTPFTDAAVFDPCQARDDHEMESGVRALAEQAGITLTELAEPNRCCGYGGHIRIANPALYEEITKNRAAAEEKPYIVYCANCKEVFTSRGKECAHILDIAFGLDRDSRPPTLEQRRENSLRVKRELMKQIKDIDFQPEPQPWDDLTLIVGDQLQEELDNKLISGVHLKEAIWLAESTGEKFYDESSGVCSCSLVKPVITYWVEYREVGPKTYEVLSAYYHRMRFEQGGE